MYLSRFAAKNRIREAQNARDNRAEIVKALSHGQITRRDLFKWGIFTATGALALKNGLSPYAKSAYAAIPTGTPPTPLFGALKFTQKMPRLNLQNPLPMTEASFNGQKTARWPVGFNELDAKPLSYHTEFTSSGGQMFANLTTGRGPFEGRPPGVYFAHQRWEEFFPKIGFQMSLGQVDPGIGFHPAMPDQEPNSVWSFKAGGLGARGTLPPPLIKMRYGEPAVVRVYNNLPEDRTLNNGFGRNEAAIHNHNAHNASASDGASNAHFFAGQFYDYHWGTTLARHDMINTDASEARASGPDGNGGLMHVPGDFRELQGTLWIHDHRFFFTAENVYKGSLGMLNYYSGPDRGNEVLSGGGVNLRLPSGAKLDWGNIDFDVNLIVADWATDQQGQYFFDIFDTDGFLGDNLHVNFAYAPYFEVLPRKYRFRILNGCMSRFIKLVLVRDNGTKLPFHFIANDGNFVVNPLFISEMDILGVAERFDIVVDFSQFNVGDTVTMINLSEHIDGRGPERNVSIPFALSGASLDPAVGSVMQFKVSQTMESADVPGDIYDINVIPPNDLDPSVIPNVLTEQIPIVTPVRERIIEWDRGGNGDSRDTFDGECIPECGEKEAFPWTVSVNGQPAHSLNANRVTNVIPKPGEIEHWILKNGGGGWDHPIHLHFEEGVTIDRGGDGIPATEFLVRKDVWRLREGGQVKFQVQFGEYGGAYVNHCHNTVHEDFAMLYRYDILKDDDSIHASIIPTPNPTPDGVQYLKPEVVPDGDPRNSQFPGEPFGNGTPGSVGTGTPADTSGFTPGRRRRT